MSTTVAALLSTGESQVLEFKASFDKAAIESLVAFANARGGKVLVGVSDTGKIIGTTVGKETLNEWLGQIKSATSPALIPEIIRHEFDGSGFIRIRRAMADYPEVRFSIEEAQGGVWAVFECLTLAVAETKTPQVTPQVQQLLDGLKGEMSRLELMANL
jgi:predicted HTH transcriptional regulator